MARFLSYGEEGDKTFRSGRKTSKSRGSGRRRSSPTYIPPRRLKGLMRERLRSKIPEGFPGTLREQKITKFPSNLGDLIKRTKRFS